MSAEGKVTDDRHLSGSMLAGWCGENSFATPLDVYTYCYNARNGIPNPGVDNIHVKIGTAFETPVIMELIPQYMPVVDVRTGFTTAYKHPHLPFSVSIDGMCRADKVIVEDGEIIKTGGEDLFLDGIGIIETKITGKYCANECPEQYKLQLFSQMECVPDCKWGMIAIVKSTMMWVWVFRKDADFGSFLESKVLDFEESLTNNNPPLPFNSIEANKLYDTKQIDSRILGEESDDLVEQYESLKKIKSNVDNSIDDIERVLKVQLGNAEVGYTNRYKIKWPFRTYKATKEKTTFCEAKPERTIRLNSIKFTRIEK